MVRFAKINISVPVDVPKLTPDGFLEMFTVFLIYLLLRDLVSALG